MRLLVTGISGRVGFCLANFFIAKGYEVSGTFLSQKPKINGAKLYGLDISNRKGTAALIKNLNPQLIIHSAALTNADLCERDNKLAYRINVTGTENIVKGASVPGSVVVFISTSNVFDGKKSEYSESEKTSSVNYYGLTKILAENVVKDSGNGYLIVRTDQPYGWTQPWQKDNSVTRAYNKLNANETYKDVVDWYNTPTYLPDLAKAIFELVNRNKNGIYHGVGPDYVNRYEWSVSMAKLFGKDPKLVRPIESKALGLNAVRANSRLDNKKIQRDTGVKFSGVVDGVKSMLRETTN